MQIFATSTVMHLGNGAITPRCTLFALDAAAAGAAISLRAPRWRRRELLSARSAGWLAAMAFLSTVASAALVVAEIAISSAATMDLNRFGSQMIGSHVVAGLFEVTSAVAIVVVLARLGQAQVQREAAKTWLFTSALSVAVIGLSLVLALLSAPALALASRLPDAYEASVAATSIDDRSAGQVLAMRAERWQEAMINAMPVPAFVAFCSTVIVGCLAAAAIWFCVVIRQRGMSRKLCDRVIESAG